MGHYGSILLHKPHPRKELLDYQVKQLREKLEQEGLIYQLLFGKVQGIRSLISYEGTTVSELIADFHGAVDDYLELCSAEGTAPEKAFKGSFNIRFKNTDLHKRAAIYAYNHNVSLNSVVEESVAEYLSTRQD